MIGNQLRANADTWDEFTAGHFTFHPFTLMGGYPEAVRVFGGEDRLYALLIDLNGVVFPGGTEGSPNRHSGREAGIQSQSLPRTAIRGM